MKTSNLFKTGAGLVVLAFAGCSVTNAKLDSEQEYVHQFNAPTKPYHINKKFSGNNLFYLETLQLNESNGLRTRIYLGEDGKIARVLMTPMGRNFNVYPNTEIKRDGKGNYNAFLEDENGEKFCMDGICSFPANISKLQEFADSHKTK